MAVKRRINSWKIIIEWKIMRKSIKILIGLTLVVGFITITNVVSPSNIGPGESDPGDPGNGSTPGIFTTPIEDNFAFTEDNAMNFQTSFECMSFKL